MGSLGDVLYALRVAVRTAEQFAATRAVSVCIEAYGYLQVGTCTYMYY